MTLPTGTRFQFRNTARAKLPSRSETAHKLFFWEFGSINLLCIFSAFYRKLHFLNSDSVSLKKKHRFFAVVTARFGPQIFQLFVLLNCLFFMNSKVKSAHSIRRVPLTAAATTVGLILIPPPLAITPVGQHLEKKGKYYNPGSEIWRAAGAKIFGFLGV